MPAEPTLADLLRHTAREVKLQIRTHAPATVISYDAARQTVRVRVDHLLTKPVISAADTARTLQQQPGSRLDEAGESIVLAPVILDGVPVAWLSTSTASFVLPMSPGDTGQIHVSDRSLDTWRDGVSGEAVDPVSATTHQLRSAVFVPGLRTRANPIASVTGTAVQLDAEAPIEIGVSSLDIKLGPAQQRPVARKTDTIALDAVSTNAITSAINAVAAAAGIPAPPFPPGVPVQFTGTITSGSAVVKAGG